MVFSDIAKARTTYCSKQGYSSTRIIDLLKEEGLCTSHCRISSSRWGCNTPVLIPVAGSNKLPGACHHWLNWDLLLNLHTPPSGQKTSNHIGIRAEHIKCGCLDDFFTASPLVVETFLLSGRALASCWSLTGPWHLTCISSWMHLISAWCLLVV